MKKIIGNKLYDTKKAELIFYYFKSKRVANVFGKWVTRSYRYDIYKTKKGNYFVHCYKNFGKNNNSIEEMTLGEVKEIIKEVNPIKYIELGFENIEEA